ncbi:MAG: asparaginase [Oscillatoriales cyanobacterium SM2_1_8]|nr:asparaginase [Oscillatoriales cyanobacterium SM2_1_8]
MNPGKPLEKRPNPPSLTVRVLREGIVESEHRAHAALVDARGRLRAAAGAADGQTFARSSLKPLQGLPVSWSGAGDRFGFQEADWAVMCGSHRGTMTHVRQVFRILWRCDVDPSRLVCPVPAGKNSPLQHNCSGKHAGALALCRHQHWDLSAYASPSHPAQRAIAEVLGEWLGLPPAELMAARDDCGFPTYLLGLQQLAHLYGRLTLSGETHSERLVRAMTRHPEMVAGAGAFDTEVMRLSGGELVCKGGAEGVQCVGRVNEGLGLAIKVWDGADRAKRVATLRALAQLGWLSPAATEALMEQFALLPPYSRLEASGELTWQ